MASIKEILSSYGSAARANYPQGDDVEDDMNYIVSFIEQHGYEFQDNLLYELRQGVGLCPIRDVFKGFRCCECEFVKDPVKVTVKYDGQTYDVINKYESKSVRSFDLRETVNDTDPVNHPNHYKMVGLFESFDIIVESLGIDGARQFCQGNIIKYQTRYKEKNGEEDLKKRHWYSRMDQMLAKCKTIKDYYKLKESDF